jgi:hypothetical protein
MNVEPPGIFTTAPPAKTYGGWRVLALVVAVLLSLPGGLLMFEWLTGLVLHPAAMDLLIPSLALSVGTAAFLCWWFALCGQHARSRQRIFSTVAGALIIGGISFAAGFFGPIILTPDANQGPLLGIFYTGPLGFFAGAVIGALVGRIQTRAVR